MLKMSTIKDNCFPAMYQRGKALFDKKAYKSFLVEDYLEDDKEYQCPGEGKRRQMV